LEEVGTEIQITLVYIIRRDGRKKFPEVVLLHRQKYKKLRRPRRRWSIRTRL